tara:strand:+ start:1011 stop:2654 length:1644 start_codon:yes stop_codon:yes gene_type:complete
MSYHNINRATQRAQSSQQQNTAQQRAAAQTQVVSGGILTYINGIPLYKTIELALKYARANGLSGYHTHVFEGVVGYMGGFNHDTAINKSKKSVVDTVKKIKSFDIDTKTLTTQSTVRSLKIEGDIGSTFTLQVIQNSASSSVGDKFYNFQTTSFDSTFGTNNFLKVTLGSSFFSINIHFPSDSIEDYRIILNAEKNTEITEGLGSSKKIIQKKIDQSGDTTITFHFHTSNTGHYSSDPPSANIVTTNKSGVNKINDQISLENVVVTNTTTDTSKIFGLAVTSSFDLATCFFVETTVNTDGETNDSATIKLDSLDNIGIGTVITSGTGVSGTPVVGGIDKENKTITVRPRQTISDNTALTFRATGVDNIKNATGAVITDSSSLSKYVRALRFAREKSMQDPSLFASIVNTESDAFNDLVGLTGKDIANFFTETTVRADGTTEATDGLSANVAVNGNNGVAKGSIIFGDNIPIAPNSVENVTTPSTSAGIVNMATQLVLDIGQDVQFIGFSRSIDFGNASAFLLIDTYPDVSTQINIDLDQFITLGTQS